VWCNHTEARVKNHGCFLPLEHSKPPLAGDKAMSLLASNANHHPERAQKQSLQMTPANRPGENTDTVRAVENMTSSEFT
jgi:hypothetical protein